MWIERTLSDGSFVSDNRGRIRPATDFEVGLDGALRTAWTDLSDARVKVANLERDLKARSAVGQ